MGTLVSRIFINNFNSMSATLTRKIGLNLDEAAVVNLEKLQRAAKPYTNKADAYSVIFTTSKGVEKLPLKHFIPEPIDQYKDGEEIEFLDNHGEEPPQWQLDALHHAASAMECSMDAALMAMMAALTHAAMIGAIFDVQ